MKHFELWNEIRPDEKRKKEILEEILNTPEMMEMKKKNTKGFRSLAAAFVLLLGVSLAYFAGKPLWIQLAKSKNTSPVITENPKVNQKSEPDSEKPKKPSVEQEMAKTLPLANYKATPNAPALDYVLHENAQGSMGYGPGFREDDSHRYCCRILSLLPAALPTDRRWKVLEQIEQATQIGRASCRERV